MVRASAASGRLHALFVAGALGALALDQATKYLALGRLPGGDPVPVLGGPVCFTLTLNTGSAFGLVSAAPVLLAVGGLVCVAVLAYVIGGRLSARPARALPLGLVLGGSVGNLLDRLRFGAVVDFIDLRVWPVFNVADVAVTVGVALLAVDLIRRG